MAARPFLPYGRQTIEDDDKAEVLRVLGSDYLTTGPEVGRFEAAMREVVGAAHAVACNSATAGLHVAAIALGLRPGDCVVVPTMTFLATANGPRYEGAEIVFADVDPDTGLMTADTLEEALRRCPRPPKAVFPVHLNGHQVDMLAIASIARRVGAAVVEDACHALGGTQPNGTGAQERTGACTHSDMAVFSFHPVKAIAMGEGGMVTTNDPALADRLALARNHGMIRDPARFALPELAFDADGKVNPWYYEMHAPGYNYRAPDINCALGTSQLKKLARFLKRRVEIADLYDERLAPLSPLLRPVPRASFGKGGWHLYPVLVDFAALGKSRRAVMEALRARQIGTQVHYIPVHRQPYYRDLSPNLLLAGAERYYERVLSLPLYPTLSDEDIGYVADALTQIVGNA